MKLTPAAHLALAVDEHLLVLEQVARLAARVDQVGQLEQLPKADHLAADGDLAALAHAVIEARVASLPVPGKASA